jgi:hypothetical protein
MSEEEFQEATEQKMSEFNLTISNLTLGLERALKNVRYYREACRTTLKEIGELNGNIQKR